MELLYISNVRLPTEKAHGIQIMENCRAFSKWPEAKVVLISARRLGVNRQDPFSYYGLARTFLFRRIFCLDLLWLPFFKTFFFMLQAGSFTISALIYAWFVGKSGDIIFTRDFYVAAVLAFIRPVFYEVHSLPNQPTWLHRRAWHSARGLIVISNGLRDDLVKWGVDKKKILVARDGFNAERFSAGLTKEEARAALAIPLGQDAVVYTGHLYEWKGADVLARAALKLPEDIHVYLVGGTKEDVAKFKNQYQAANIHIIGHRPQNEIPTWLKAADVLVIPNSAKEKISSRYTSPLKLFEYMASGRPIIAADLPSIREVLGDGEAVFFAPDNSQDLGQKIISSLNNQAALLEQARLAQAKVGQYTWENRGRLIKRFMLAYSLNMGLNE